jgi:hypothetical protein
MKIILFFLSLTASSVLYSQTTRENYKVWSSFLVEAFPEVNHKRKEFQLVIYIEDSTFRSGTSLERISPEYFQDMIKTTDYRWDGLNDSSWVNLFLKYDESCEKRVTYRIRNSFDNKTKIKIIGKKEIARFADFPDKNKTLITFTDCVFDDSHSKCIFFYSSYGGFLYGGGYLVFMEKKDKKWKIHKGICIWVN